MSTALRILRVVALLAVTTAAVAQAAPPPLVLEAKIPLGAVGGRLDHLAIDLNRHRLFVAELGDDSLGVVDLAARRSLRIVSGFREPQGVGYEPSTDTVYVANGGDGSVRLLRGRDLVPIGRLDLGADADNVRVDAAHRRVVVGYGAGGLAIIDAVRRVKIGDIHLAAHPEAFQLDADDKLAFANVPDAHQIAIADLASGAVRALPTGSLRSNFPMALDPAMHRILVGFRSPPTLAGFTVPDGRLAARLPVCDDADDVFVDAKRHRVYVSCGAGVIDVLQITGSTYARVARVPTAAGARTSLFVPQLDRLYVAVRSGWTEPAAIWVFRVAPDRAVTRHGNLLRSAASNRRKPGRRDAGPTRLLAARRARPQCGGATWAAPASIQGTPRRVHPFGGEAVRVHAQRWCRNFRAPGLIRN